MKGRKGVTVKVLEMQRNEGPVSKSVKGVAEAQMTSTTERKQESRRATHQLVRLGVCACGEGGSQSAKPARMRELTIGGLGTGLENLAP